jgi:hypothetical protein
MVTTRYVTERMPPPVVNMEKVIQEYHLSLDRLRRIELTVLFNGLRKLVFGRNKGNNDSHVKN